LYSLVETAKANDLVVHDYISTCLQRLAEQPDNLEPLLPWDIKLGVVSYTLTLIQMKVKIDSPMGRRQLFIESQHIALFRIYKAVKHDAPLGDILSTSNKLSNTCNTFQNAN
ncbi:transposase domain-containing protein, partial [Pseudoalteromonas rhizosphaerae]